MRKVKVLVVEDEILIGEGIRSNLQSFGYEAVPLVSESQEVLRSIIIHKPDLILMDINLSGKEDGITTATKINEKHDIPIIYLTGLKDDETFHRAKVTLPQNYLQKPIEEKELRRQIELAIFKYSTKDVHSKEKQEKTQAPTERFLFVRKNQGHYKINLKEILWIASDGAYSKIITAEDTYTIAKNSRIVLQEINSPDFFRVHRSYIVNILHVIHIKGNELIFKRGSIPVGRTFRKDVKMRIQRL